MRTSKQSRPALVGNRMVLVGAVVYLLEWVAILAAHVDAPLGGSASGPELTSTYAHHVGALGWAAGWFSLVLLGRILLMVGLRAALEASGRPQRLMDLAVAAMTVSVVLEIATYAMASGASWAVMHGSPVSTVRVADAVAFQTDQMIWAPLGASLVCAGISMWQSALFVRVLPVLAVAAGVAGLVAGAALAAPAQQGVADGVTSLAALGFWVWMVWTGVVVWRAGRSAPQGSRAPESVAVR